jgi:hypothetical protein
MWPSTTGEFALFLILLVGGALIVSTLAGTAAALVAVRVVGPRESRWFGPPATFAGIAVFAAVIDGRGSIAIVAILALSVAVLVTLVGRLGGAANPPDQAVMAAAARSADPEGTIAALRRRVGRRD